MNGKEIKDKLNGKKRYIAGGASVSIGLAFLIPFLINLNGTVSANEVKIGNNKENYKKVEKVPEHIATIKANLENLKENVGKMDKKQEDFRVEQRQSNRDILNAIATRGEI